MAVLVLLLTRCRVAAALPPPHYSAKEIRASVVDEASGRPLEGVVIVAKWSLRGLGGQGPTLQIVEAVTDQDGRFVVPGWGPRPRPPFMHLGSHSPQLILFKTGYKPLALSSESQATFADINLEGQPDAAAGSWNTHATARGPSNWTATSTAFYNALNGY